MKHIAISLLLSLQPVLFFASQENVSVASRHLSEEAKEKMKRIDEDFSIEESHETRTMIKKKTQESRSSLHDHGFKSRKKEREHRHLFSSYPQFTNHWLASKNFDGSILEMEDGSHWKIARNNSTNFWERGDALTISPNKSWNSEYSYYIINNVTSAYVPADLILGPIAFGPWTHWVLGLDYHQGKVFLENGSTWKVSGHDENLLREWQINDTIIFARNSSWFSKFDNVLINVNLNHYIHVRQY